MTGQRVVCVDDAFPRGAGVLYKHLPKKGSMYTVRGTFLGKTKVGSDDEADVGVLLKELLNPPDPTAITELELGFSANRFAPLEELPPAEEEIEVEDEILVPV